MINRGGEKISAEEVGNLILQHPKIKNIACVPMPDERLGERICAYVILQGNHKITLDELVSFLQEREIAKFKLPERLEVLEEFPISTFGKVSKKILTEEISKKIGEERGSSK